MGDRIALDQLVQEGRTKADALVAEGVALTGVVTPPPALVHMVCSKCGAEHPNKVEYPNDHPAWTHLCPRCTLEN